MENDKMESEFSYNAFRAIMLNNWTIDEITYLPHIVMHPSYDPNPEDEESGHA